jgi:nicotinate phosphoribosyltransferase
MRTLTPASTTDLYELTMAAGYWAAHRPERAVFELFVRHLPRGRGYLLTAGLEDAVAYLENFHFTAEEIAGLRALPAFAATPPAFFNFLAELRFTGDVWAMPEGTPAFANEPLLVVDAPIIEAQIVETALLALVNYPTSLATKAARVLRAAGGRAVVEFGARRAPGSDAALIAARAAFIGGCVGTSNVEAGLRCDIPVYGTIAHSWVMSFDDEIEAFRAYQQCFPHNAILLIDTYDTVRAARGITEAFRPDEVAGVRLDSGDLGALAREVRAVLDQAGFTGTQIFASGDLNESAVADLVAGGAPSGSFGVGTDLTTVRDAPAPGGVYKLVEIRRDGQREPKMKLSAEKMTYPGQKQVWRHAGPDGRFTGDTVTLMDEPRPAPGAEPMLVPVVQGGRRALPRPPLAEIQAPARAALARLPEPLLELDPPAEPYPVRFSDRILALQADLRRRYGF